MTRTETTYANQFDQAASQVLYAYCNSNTIKDDGERWQALKQFTKLHCPLPVYSTEASVQDLCEKRLIQALWHTAKQSFSSDALSVINCWPYHSQLTALWSDVMDPYPLGAIVTKQGVICRPGNADAVLTPTVSEVIAYDDRGTKPPANYYWNHVFAELVTGKAPSDKWSFHNYIVRLLKDMNDLNENHGLQSPFFHHQQGLHKLIESSRCLYLEAKAGRMDYKALLATPLFSEMVRVDTDDLDADYRRYINVVAVPMAFKSVKAAMKESAAAIDTLLGDSAVLQWLRQAYYAKTLPKVIEYNVLAVKGLTDAQMLELSEKRLAIAQHWYGPFLQGKVTLDQVRQMHAALQAGGLDAIKGASAALPDLLRRAAEAYVALASDPLYEDQERRDNYFKSVVSNLQTFINKMEKAAS